MSRKMVALSMVAVFLFALIGCTPKNPTSPTQPGSPASPEQTVTMETNPTTLSPSPATALDASPLAWLLRAVPSEQIESLWYSDIPALSAYQNQAIPSRETSPQEKIKWWMTFQRNVLAGSSFPTVTDVWGFDAVDMLGGLTFYRQEYPSVSIFAGHFDIANFREALKAYKYSEESYLGYPLFYGIPQNVFDVRPPLFDFSPRAFSIIEGVKTSGDEVSLIVMAEKFSDVDVTRSKMAVQSVLQAYEDKTALAYSSDGLAALVNSLGRVGSAFIAVDFRVDIPEWMSAEERASCVGPGKLSPYNQLAITLQKEGDDFVLEFILDYGNSAIAMANAATLESRLREGLSFTKKPLADLWTVREVKGDGSLLRARVKLIQQPGGTTRNLTAMIFSGDYWFLYPN